jgi:hypothetical protein
MGAQLNIVLVIIGGQIQSYLITQHILDFVRLWMGKPIGGGRCFESS